MQTIDNAVSNNNNGLKIDLSNTISIDAKSQMQNSLQKRPTSHTHQTSANFGGTQNITNHSIGKMATLSLEHTLDLANINDSLNNKSDDKESTLKTAGGQQKTLYSMDKAR